MRQFLALFIARNKEYYRDRASLSWAFLFPLLVIIACALAFSSPDETLFTVGVDGDLDRRPAVAAFLERPWIKHVPVPSLERGIERTRYHQLDLLISDQGGGRYWINGDSAAGAAAETLLLEAASGLERRTLTGRRIRYVDWVIPGVLGMNLMFGSLFGVGYVIVRYRHNGVLKRLQATPVTPLQFLAAQMASRLTIVVTINATIFLGCLWLLDLIVLGNYLNLLWITILGALAMIALGLVVASRTANEELAGGLLNVATWPMLIMSDVWFSLDEAPNWMQGLAEAMPLTHIVRATRAVMLEGATLAEVAHHLLWLAVMTAACLGLASLLFRWHKR